MIGRISGQITEKLPGTILIGAGPVEYEVFVTVSDWSTSQAGSQGRFYIYEQIREDAHNLYGFSSLEGKEMFVRLLGVSGVGPKVAMAILSSATLEQIRKAVASGDPELLKGVVGVGKKTAERIIVELKSKLAEGSIGSTLAEDSAYQALIGLGYNQAQAAQAVAGLPSEIKDDQERIKLALRGVRK